MRKPRDFDAELKALDAKAKALKTRQRDQLGELVRATGADSLPLDMLTGALLAAVANTDKATREGWAKTGAAFFQRGGQSGSTRRVSQDVKSTSGVGNRPDANSKPDGVAPNGPASNTGSASTTTDKAQSPDAGPGTP